MKVSQEQKNSLDGEMLESFWDRTLVEVRSTYGDLPENESKSLIRQCRKDCVEFHIQTENGMFSYSSASFASGEALSRKPEFHEALQRAPKEKKSPDDVAVIAFEMILFIDGQI